jgi:TRAP-type uncharacterized transport system substrate-binding protein
MFRKTLLTTFLATNLIFANHVAKAQDNLATTRLCTGLINLNYDWAGHEIQKQAKGRLNIVLINSKGSLENLEKLGKECDVAIVQSDATYAIANSSSIEFGPPLYKELWHLICNTDANISRITELNKNTKLLLGANGGGAEVTWLSFVKADPNRYGVVPHDPIGGLRAAGIVQQGGNAACMAVVTGLNAPGIKEISESATQSNNMRLIPSNDSDILKIKDSKGHFVYMNEEIPSGTYRGLQPRSIMGSSVNTVGVNAMIVVSSDYLDKHDGDYEKFLSAVKSAVPGIKAHVEAQ